MFWILGHSWGIRLSASGVCGRSADSISQRSPNLIPRRITRARISCSGIRSVIQEHHLEWLLRIPSPLVFPATVAAPHLGLRLASDSIGLPRMVPLPSPLSFTTLACTTRGLRQLPRLSQACQIFCAMTTLVAGPMETGGNLANTVVSGRRSVLAILHAFGALRSVSTAYTCPISSRNGWLVAYWTSLPYHLDRALPILVPRALELGVP